MKIKTPKIFFFFQEIIEVAFNVKPALVEKMAETIKKLNQDGCCVGLLTDRSLWFLKFFFANNGGIGFNNFDFIQTRKSILNRLINPPPPPSAKKIFSESKKTKPDVRIFQNLKKFAAENNIEAQEILIIDDLPQVIECAKANGFLVSRVKY